MLRAIVEREIVRQGVGEKNIVVLVKEKRFFFTNLLTQQDRQSEFLLF